MSTHSIRFMENWVKYEYKYFWLKELGLVRKERFRIFRVDWRKLSDSEKRNPDK